MNRYVLELTAFAMASYYAIAGVGGVVVKGSVKTWDEIAKVALKVSGKSMTDDAVKAASKTIENAASSYGDDVAKAAMQGGIEVAEQSVKHGSAFVSIIKKAGKYSDDAVKAIAQNSDDAVKYVEKYGDDVVKLSAKAPGAFARGFALIEKSGAVNTKRAVKVIATEIPAEQVPQVLGVIEKNPQVAGPFLDAVAKGGKHFVDKLFALNAKQIMTGGLSLAAIDAAHRATASFAAEGKAIEKQSETAMAIINKGSSEEQKQFAEKIVNQNGEVRKCWGQVVLWPSIIVSCFGGLALMAFVLRKTRSR